MLDILSLIGLYSHGHLINTSLGTQTHVDVPFDLNMVLNNKRCPINEFLCIFFRIDFFFHISDIDSKIIHLTGVISLQGRQKDPISCSIQ